MKLQNWRIKTFVRIIKFIIWNTCILIIISKFEHIFLDRKFFSNVMLDIKGKIKEADFLSKIDSDFKSSALIDIFANFNLYLENIFNLYLRAIIDIFFKHCLLGILKFYFVIEFFAFVIMKHKYTIQYAFVYLGLFILVFSDFNFFYFSYNHKNKNTDNIRNKKVNEYAAKNPNFYKLDFVSFCYILLLISSGYLFMNLCYLKISLWDKRLKKGKIIRLVFYSMFILGLLL